jgi:hypothetical protein
MLRNGPLPGAQGLQLSWGLLRLLQLHMRLGVPRMVFYHTSCT